MTTAKAAKKVNAIRVTAKRDNFRRAGHTWSGTTFVNVESVSDERLKQLQAEPLLVVDECEVEDTETLVDLK